MQYCVFTSWVQESSEGGNRTGALRQCFGYHLQDIWSRWRWLPEPQRVSWSPEEPNSSRFEGNRLTSLFLNTKVDCYNCLVRKKLYFKLKIIYCLWIWEECCHQELVIMHVNYGSSSIALHIMFTQSVSKSLFLCKYWTHCNFINRYRSSKAFKATGSVWKEKALKEPKKCGSKLGKVLFKAVHCSFAISVVI